MFLESAIPERMDIEALTAPGILFATAGPVSLFVEALCKPGLAFALFPMTELAVFVKTLLQVFDFPALLVEDTLNPAFQAAIHAVNGLKAFPLSLVSAGDIG